MSLKRKFACCQFVELIELMENIILTLCVRWGEFGRKEIEKREFSKKIIFMLI